MPEVASSVEPNDTFMRSGPVSPWLEIAANTSRGLTALKRLVAESRAVEHTAAEILDHDVAVLRQLADNALAAASLRFSASPRLLRLVKRNCGERFHQPSALSGLPTTRNGSR